ncbi:MAG: ABC transporter permease [Oscillospiraceae bacterium]|jgi:spermidine/putrescine transport system permease protein|nr:ABC transporter permease [Oscillospiraceae bacterium]
MNRGRRRSSVIAVLPMYLFTLAFVLGPLIYMLFLSFESRSGQWGVTADFTLRNYTRIAEPLFMKTFWNSTKLALISTVFVLLIGYPFGYFMARLSKKWRSVCMLLLIIPFWTSALMRLYGWIIFFRANGVLDTLLMKIGLIDRPLKLLYSYPSVVVGMVYVLLPFMIYSVYASAEKLDWRLVEAARDLGASRFGAFRTVSLPLTAPGIFSGVILTFVPSMGLYFLADILGGNKTILVGNLIYEQLMKIHDWPFAAAISVVLLLLTSIFLFAYRRITKSDLEGLV